MAPSWAYAFVTAALLTLAGTPLLRRVALATDLVDHPVAAHKSHKKSTPYLGGIGLIAAVLVGLLFTSRLTPQVAVVALGGSLIGCLGLLDDHRSVGALFRFGVELAVAAVALAVGLRIHATDIPAIDGVITMIWIVGVTNAVNLLDNMDGLAAGVSAAASVAIFGLAVLGEQPVTATLAAGMAGACVGFLAHNKRPASIFMGDTGSLFLGFVLAVATIGVSPALTPPASFAVPLLLLALPVLDTATVTVSRLRRGRSISQGGKDHLSHRLVARGLSPGLAVGVLVAVEATVGMLAILAGRQILSLAVALALSSAALTGLAVFTMTASVYTEAVTGMPRRLKLAFAVGLGGLLLLAAPATVALARAHGPGIAGADATREGLRALLAGDAPRATALFDRSSLQLRRAADLLDGRLSSLGLLLPGLRANLATSRALVQAGQDVAAQASGLAAVVEASNLPLRAGSNPAAAGERLAPALAAAASVSEDSAGLLIGYDRPYLWPSLGATVSDVRTHLLEVSSRTRTAAEVARLLPAMLGEHEPRRYLMVVQDNTELRGTGGVPRLWGQLVAEKGRLRLTDLGPIDELNRTGAVRSLDAPAGFIGRYRDFDVANTWQNVNVSPDFSVTGGVIAQLYSQTGRRPVDGVVAVDLPGLAALLGVAGPVEVDGWDEPLTAANLLDVLVRGSYDRFSTAEERQAFLARLTEATMQAFISADLGTPSSLARALAPAASGGHVLFYAARPEEEHLARSLGAAGDIPTGAGDSLMVVNQNLSGSDIDPYLRRIARYDVRLDPMQGSARLNGQLEVVLQNEAPATGLPQQVIGPFDSRFSAGENRTFLSVYSPLLLRGAKIDGRPATVRSEREFNRHVYSSAVSIPAKESRTLQLQLDGRVELTADKWYRLALRHQTSLTPVATEISLTVPNGWRIVDARGLRINDSRHASATLGDNHDELAVRLERTPWSRLWAGARP